MYTKISDYGLIGNCRSAALVSKWGSIDWACLPDFDSQAYFCKLLDDKKGGFFDIHPLGFYQSSQSYIDDTNILKTTFFNHSGRILLTDFVPISKDEEESNNVSVHGLKFIRRVKSEVGNHRIRVEVKVTPNYGAFSSEAKISGDKLIFESGDENLVLFSPEINLEIKSNIAFYEFELKEGEEKLFALGYFSNQEEALEFNSSIAKKFYDETLKFWLWWVSLSRYNGIYRDQVIRSSLALKLLTFNPTGAVIAAPTTSLPEKLGGNLNWDYRFVWLRDASFTMYAFLGLGYLKEAVEFMTWLEKVCVEEGENIQIMYSINGEKLLTEKTVDLSGYEDSKPVRVGNAAFSQKQLDVYGELLSCLDLYVSSGGELKPKMKQFIITLVNICQKIWSEKDAGIWETRETPQHHTYSKLMCWVGVNHGIALAEKLDLEVDIEEWLKTESAIKDDIIEKGFNDKVGAFVETYGQETLDSSNLNIPLVGFLPAADPKVLSTLDKTMASLTKDWFVYRTNDQTDKLKDGEGAFFLSTFWVIDTLSTLGREQEAKIWLEKIIRFATPLGLYAEMLDPKTHDHLGNFPQAFTHLGLINSSLNLNKAIHYGPEKLAIRPAERLSQVAKLVNKQIEEGLELLIPSTLRKHLLAKELRRTKRHSIFGRLLHKN